MGCETSKAYTSETKMLNQTLNKIDFIKRLPFIADKGYDSINIIQKILDIGLSNQCLKLKDGLFFRIST